MHSWREQLQQGQVIPACPLTLHEDGRWSQRHQRALIQYYVEAGAGGLAVGVHSTQFAIRDPRHGLFRPVLQLAAKAIETLTAASEREFIRIAGICGGSLQAQAEAEFARDTGYHAGLLSLKDLAGAEETVLLQHARQIAQVLPVIGFYLQPAVGGRVLSYRFWREFAEIENVVAIKIAPFNRYQTWDVVRGVIESGRDDLSLYTGNDDNILVDLLTPFRYAGTTRLIVGGLLGQWGVWTKRAVELFEQVRRLRGAATISSDWLTLNGALTDANAAVFDAAHAFQGCIPGIMEVLRRQGLAPSNRCLDPHEVLSPGQAEELDRVIRVYPHLTDDEFVRAHVHRWLDQE